ncbi:MFS transporter (macronuclear) [Tetrahymena thermophila SB210]|uniref:MFS transporter n=1 Tax=Tetrahymena thermophila (strain SB210) TaxID=312017 RepID=I7MK43_TETTS|nr:MFS transporter [Tetrahymena thermophila SB210]EAR97520.2 MFS transporter [Tetrahymena thermophila SB210]|eukprot:XP_001017765.2 MFS transporter [Tetrahymena thermophila SB210]
MGENFKNSHDKLLVELDDMTRISSKFVEEGLHQVGDDGFYQMRLLFIFFAQWMVSVFIFVGPVYYFPDPEFQCSNGESCTEDSGGCNEQKLISSPYNTITSDYKLYCDNRNLRSVSQSALFWGPIFGNIFFSFIADWKGRRLSLIAAWSLNTLGILGITFSQNIYQLILMIFITGFSLVPCNNLNLIMVNEQSGEAFRQRGTTLLLMSWAVFEIFLVPIAKYIYNWRNIFIYFTLFPSCVIAVLNYLYIYESPRFLLTKELRNEMYSTLNRIAKVNKREAITEQDCFINPLESSKAQKIYTYLDLVKYKSLRLITIASCLVMFFTQMIYYSTQYSLGSVGSSLYINTLVVGAGEAIAYFLCNQVAHKLQRKLFTFIFYTSSIFLCLLFLFVKSDINQTILACLVRIFNCGTLCILALFVEELYPTTVRSLGVGAQMSIGVAGSSLAPIVIDLAKKLGINPLLATGIISIPAIYTISFFKETKGEPLQDDILEFQQETKDF